MTYSLFLLRGNISKAAFDEIVDGRIKGGREHPVYALRVV